MPKGKHNNHRRGSNHPRWNSNKIITSHGYSLRRVGRGHPLEQGNGYAYEHLMVWVEAGNPVPDKDQILHHINGIKTDNRLENLRLMNRGLHIMDEHATRGPNGRLQRKPTDEVPHV